MLEKIKKVYKLQKELNKEHGILDISETVEGNLLLSFTNIKSFQEATENLPIITEDVSHLTTTNVTVRLIAKKDDIEFVFYAHEKEYEEYKNSRATNTAKERLDA